LPTGTHWSREFPSTDPRSRQLKPCGHPPTRSPPQPCKHIASWPSRSCTHRSRAPPQASSLTHGPWHNSIGSAGPLVPVVPPPDTVDELDPIEPPAEDVVLLDEDAPDEEDDDDPWEPSSTT
jgi:hypothetical protein